MTRPHLTFGPVGVALLRAAVQGPAPVQALAERAQVGRSAARYTASRLERAGVLYPVDEARPRRLAVAADVAAMVPGFLVDGEVLML
jgi:DNA-binding IclR family transcriptional regulator